MCIHAIIFVYRFVRPSVYIRTQKSEPERSRDRLFQSDRKEKKQYITTFVFQYDSRLSPNTISGEEKRNWYEQICLISDDPNRHHLDSIFQAELDNRKIRGSVAIQCAVGDKVTISRPEAFYRKATALDAVSYRKDLDAGQKIILQPYVHLPYRWLAGCWPFICLSQSGCPEQHCSSI